MRMVALCDRKVKPTNFQLNSALKLNCLNSEIIEMK